MDARSLWKEVLYASRAEDAGIYRDQLCGLCSGSVSSGRYPRLACRLDFLDPGLRRFLRWHSTALQVQSRSAARAHELLSAESKNLGQGVHSVLLSALPCLDGADPIRCSAFSLVVYAPFPPGCRSHSVADLVCSHGPDLS